MKFQLSALVALAAAAIGQAAELHAAGAIRTDHETKWSALRVSLDQLNDAAKEAETAAEADAPAAPDAAAFDELRHIVETLALTVDHTGDQVQSLVDLANSPKG